MKNLCLLAGLSLAIWVLAGCQTGPAGLTLVKDGKSDYAIVVSPQASESEKWAAQDLGDHLWRMTGAGVLIVWSGVDPNTPLRTSLLKDGHKIPRHFVFVGDGPEVAALGVTLDETRLGDEGFVIKTVGDNLVIAGGRVRGTMYGVYELLSQLGCRWWAPDASTIPTRKTITIPPTDIVKVPALEYRDMTYGDLNAPGSDLWCARNRINGGRSLRGSPNSAKYGGAFTFYSLAHTFHNLVPPRDFFTEHPEYYALRDGKRITDQLCLSNPDLPGVVAKAILKIAAQHPEYHHFTFGQDDNESFCQCDQCQALYEKYGAQSGAMILCTNRIAEIVNKERPGTWVATMAYQWSRKPPQGVVPNDHVMVVLCSIECNFANPLFDGVPEENAAFKADTETWAKICPKLYVWDYTTDFNHYLLPWPNYYVLAPNAKFFAQNQVRGVYEEGAHNSPVSQFSKLNMWVAAQALWNPRMSDVDGKKLVEEFCLGYYGPKAGPLIVQYANLLHRETTELRNLPIHIYEHVVCTYLTEEAMAGGEQLFEQAEAAVKDDPVLVRRVQIAHLPVLYALLYCSNRYAAAVRAKVPAFSWDAAAQQLVRVCQEEKVTIGESRDAGRLYEWALHFGKLMKTDDSDLPPELRSAPVGSFRLYHAAQLERMRDNSSAQPLPGEVAAGSSDGWGNPIPPGQIEIPRDLIGRRVRMFLRLRANAAGLAGPVIDLTVIPLLEPEATRKPLVIRQLKAEELTGQWQVIEVGTLIPPGPSRLYFAPVGSQTLGAAYLDSVWYMFDGGK